MKSVGQMTEEDVDKAFGVILDSQEQQRLMDNVDDPDAWLLDFVYDSSLRKQLEDYSEKLTQANELDSTLSKQADTKETKLKI